MNVAGAGIAPASRGYGPRKVLLLHPAMFCSYGSRLQRDTTPPPRYDNKDILMYLRIKIKVRKPVNPEMPVHR